MKLEEIYLSSDIAERLFDKLESYNEKHKDDMLTAQEFAKYLLVYGIKYTKVDDISLPDVY